MHPPIATPFLPDDLLEKPVYDVLGRPLGRVRAVEPADGGAQALDVALDPPLAEILGSPDLWIGATAIVSAEEVVMLNDDAAHLLAPP